MLISKLINQRFIKFTFDVVELGSHILKFRESQGIENLLGNDRENINGMIKVGEINSPWHKKSQILICRPSGLKIMKKLGRKGKELKNYIYI